MLSQGYRKPTRTLGRWGQAKIHYQLDGLFYTQNDSDTVLPIISTSEGTDNGYDVFYWSSHNAKPTEASYRIGGKKYH